MDLLIWAIVIVGTLVATAFNYILNLAPGSDPEDFRVGPSELNITCDCSLNVLIVGGIVILALSAASGVFDSRMELYFVGGISFAVITIAGIIGRRKRHREWRELRKVISRAIPKSPYYRAPVDIIFDDEEDEEDYFGFGE